MSIALASINNAHYQPLADITVKLNKNLYCEKHGYIPYFKNDGWKNSIGPEFQGNTHALGFEKISTILEIFDKYDDVSWVWFTDCDSMITNMNTSVLDIIADYKNLSESQILISQDGNGINVGSMIVHRSPLTIEYLKFILSQQTAYKDKAWNEQQVIIDTYQQPKWCSLIEIIPQYAINAYDYDLYQQSQYSLPLHKAKVNGQWHSGQLLIHWPGMTLDQRLALANKYLGLVSK